MPPDIGAASVDTKERLIEEATRLFAERGFYGVSIAVIAEECGITKQSLLYHFSSKEKLYEAVIRSISQNTIRMLRSYQSEERAPEAQLEAFFMAQLDHAMEQPVSSRVILRELMDNRRRAEAVEEWMLKPYLDGIADLVGQVPAFRSRSWEERFSFAYQIQGAIFYFMISTPTLENMYGRDRYEGIAEAFRSTLKAQIERFQEGANT